VVGDVDGEMSKFLRHDQQLFVLVRPDRYIFGVFKEPLKSPQLSQANIVL
jgi:hypothetical protein